MRFPSRPALVLIAAACSASVAAALVAQHRFGMEPCPWCILQRILFIALAGVSLIAALQPWVLARRVLSLVLVALSGAGVASAWWQHFVAAKTNSCALTLADKVITTLGVDTRWPEAFEVRASCADAAVNLLGVPFEFWSMALFALVGMLALVCTVSAERRHG